MLAAIHGLRLLCCLVGFWPSCGWSAGFDETTYDASIKAAVAQWWTDLDTWKLWKAQLFQESRLDPKATSPVGAAGLAQIMPATWKGLAATLRFPDTASAFDADYAIQAGAYYDARLRWTWRTNRTPLEAHWLATASYNRGTGNILKDQAECGGARLWPEIAPCTARHTTETVIYNDRIQRYWKELEAQP